MTGKQKIAAGVVALVAVSGAGAAVAATQLKSPQQESRAVVNDAAKQLGVTPERLTNALKTAQKNRVDAAVKAGELTKEQGDALKARIDADDAPLVGPGFHHGRGFGHPGGRHFKFGFRGHKLDVAAKYLGMTDAALRTALQNGKTLAGVARDRDKSVDGLVNAILAESNKKIDQAVKDERLTKAQADELKSGLKQRITDLVNGRHPRMGRGGGPRFHEFREFRGAGAGAPMISPAF